MGQTFAHSIAAIPMDKPVTDGRVSPSSIAFDFESRVIIGPGGETEMLTINAVGQRADAFWINT